MPNPASAQTGDLLLRAECQPNPVVGRGPSAHEVHIENAGPSDLFVKEVQVLVGRGNQQAALMLERDGQTGTRLSVKPAGTFVRWAFGDWIWQACRTPLAAGGEVIVTTVM